MSICKAYGVFLYALYANCIPIDAENDVKKSPFGVWFETFAMPCFTICQNRIVCDIFSAANRYLTFWAGVSDLTLLQASRMEYTLLASIKN